MSQEISKAQMPVHRWYDRDAQLSDLVRTMERLSPDSQVLFGHILKQTAWQLIKHRGRTFVRNLNWETFMGILKSKRSRRWYDRDHTLHTAFNLLFSLADGDRALIGRELSIPAELVHHYETYAQSRNEDICLDVVQSILETCFREGPHQAVATYSIFH
jgi:hypothetical protein